MSEPRVFTVGFTFHSGGLMNGARYSLKAVIEIEATRMYSEGELKFLLQSFGKDVAHGPIVDEILNQSHLDETEKEKTN